MISIYEMLSKKWIVNYNKNSRFTCRPILLKTYFEWVLNSNKNRIVKIPSTKNPIFGVELLFELVIGNYSAGISIFFWFFLYCLTSLDFWYSSASLSPGFGFLRKGYTFVDHWFSIFRSLGYSPLPDPWLLPSSMKCKRSLKNFGRKRIPGKLPGILRCGNGLSGFFVRKAFLKNTVISSIAWRKLAMNYWLSKVWITGFNGKKVLTGGRSSGESSPGAGECLGL